MQLPLKLYQAASMERWNDRIRPVELTELDKQAHKMIVAYVLGKCEEDEQTSGFDWIQIIEAGLFEYLQRIVLTDLKPPLFHKIKENEEKYARLNQWVYERMLPLVAGLGDEFCERFHHYLVTKERNVNRRIISAAHFYATKWEFDVIERADPEGYLIDEIRKDISAKQERYGDLKSMQRLLASETLRDFVNICAQLRFQVRWSHLHRVPKTSVLGHMLIVAILSYLFSYSLGADRTRLVNNYFTALFHDLPEVLTRDIINPVKRSVEGLRELIAEYEHEEMEKKIYKLIPSSWHAQMRMFTENEFTNMTRSDGTIERDGELLKAIDDLAAFIEVHLAFQNGIRSKEFASAQESLLAQYGSKVISGINFGQIYREFLQT